MPQPARILQAGARLLSPLLPRQRPATDAGLQVWTIGPLDSYRWTGLDTPPSPAELMVAHANQAYTVHILPGRQSGSRRG
jgi:hypothetical protein